MSIRQIKHKICNTIVTLDTSRPDNSPEPSPPTRVLYCPECKRNVSMDEITPKGAVCVLFTQK